MGGRRAARRGAGVLAACGLLAAAGSAFAQVPPSAPEEAGYRGLLAAAARGNVAQIRALVGQQAEVDSRDDRQRTPLHVAAYRRRHNAMRALVAAGADPNALEGDRYDIVTIAAVADDPATLRLALELGASPANVTSRWDGTALIAAAHLGHTEVVCTLIRAGAPLDHVNNLGWTAVIEAIVLGNGGTHHRATLAALIRGGADLSIADGRGQTPLELARARRYQAMVDMLLDPAGAPDPC